MINPSLVDVKIFNDLVSSCKSETSSSESRVASILGRNDTATSKNKIIDTPSLAVLVDNAVSWSASRAVCAADMKGGSRSEILGLCTGKETSKLPSNLYHAKKRSLRLVLSYL
jgi:hypothetical protein